MSRARAWRCAVVLSLLAGPALADRFPQPVPAGELPGRDVLGPTESQTVLGTVRRVVTVGDGQVALVVATGGVFGWFTHDVAVPLGDVALLGRDLMAVGITPAQLAALPGVATRGETPVPPGTILQVGLAKPAH